MVIARRVKDKLSSTPAGVVLTTRDFGVEMRYQPALAKALNRYVLQGKLQKIAKGKYYIPKKTIFGELKPCRLRVGKRLLGAEWENYRLHYGDNGLCINGTDHTDQLVRPCRYKQVSTAHHKKRSKNLLFAARE